MSGHPVCLELMGFSPANPGLSEIGVLPAGVCGPPTFPQPILTLWHSALPAPSLPSPPRPPLPSPALTSGLHLCTVPSYLQTLEGRWGQGCSRLESCPWGLGSGGNDGHRKGGRTGSFQCLVGPAIPMSSQGQLPKQGAGGEPRKASSHGTAWAEAGDWTVCAVSGDPGVIGRGHSLGHVGWGRSGKRIQVHTKGPPGLTLVVDLDPSSSRKFCLYIAKHSSFGGRP